MTIQEKQRIEENQALDELRMRLEKMVEMRIDHYTSLHGKRPSIIVARDFLKTLDIPMDLPVTYTDSSRISYLEVF